MATPPTASPIAARSTPPPHGKQLLRDGGSPDCVTSHFARDASAPASPAAFGGPLRLLRLIRPPSAASSASSREGDAGGGSSSDSSSDGGSPAYLKRHCHKPRSFRARRLSDCPGVPMPRELRLVRELERGMAAAINDQLPITRDLQLYQSVVDRRAASGRRCSLLKRSC